MRTERQQDHNAGVDVELPLVSRQAEISAVRAVIGGAVAGHGEALLFTGEAGVGKTRLLREARVEAERRGLPVLRGRAVEAGGAYRPLVEAFARLAAPFSDDPRLAGVRPTLARVLPGWAGAHDVLAPMADPSAVLAEALMLLLHAAAPGGAMVMLDDLHWADPDTLAVITSLVDSVDSLPLALVLAARTEPLLPAPLQQLGRGGPLRQVSLGRLEPSEVAEALRTDRVPSLPIQQVEQLVAMVDGLPLVLDELVRQLREGATVDGLDVSRSTLAASVQLRLVGVPADARLVLDVLSVIGDTDPEVLSAATGLDPDRLIAALHGGLASTLLVTAATPLGVAWRHRLMADAARDQLLPLEQQVIARRAADRLANEAEPTDGRLHQAARLYELAGYPQLAARQLVRAARVAVRGAALDVADQYLTDAETLSGTLPNSGREVVTERLEVLVQAGRAGDAYRSGMAALRGGTGDEAHRLLAATVRAAYHAGLNTEAAPLLAQLEQIAEPDDPDLAVLRAQAALADRNREALSFGRHAAKIAGQCGRFDLVCEALLIAGTAARRHDTEVAAPLLQEALILSETHDLAVWQVRALGELGMLDLLTGSDHARLHQARERAIVTGMLGTVATLDVRIGQVTFSREGSRAAYPIFLRADSQARQLQLVGLQAQTRGHLAECLLFAGDPTLSEQGHGGGPQDPHDLISQAAALSKGSTSASWVRGLLGVRAWFDGDNVTAIQLIEESLSGTDDEFHQVPWWGIAALLKVIDGSDPEKAFGPAARTGHHANWAARGYATAVHNLRNDQAVGESITEADRLVRRTPLHLHMLRTIVAPVLYRGGIGIAVNWLREADAFCGATGERALHRRVRDTLAGLGVKVPRSAGTALAPQLARFGITAREAEILALVNAGLGNPEIAARLVISIRTVETHVSSMLQKTGCRSRDQLPAATSDVP